MMKDSEPTIWCEVVFLRAEEGGRRLPLAPHALRGCTYRPHLVVGDPQQRGAIVENRALQEEYLGVAFLDAEIAFEWGEPFLAELVLMYPGVNCKALVSGATFTIREGPQIVGYGEVIG